MCGRCYISHIGEVMLSISSAYHIHLLCKMHLESCAISYDYQSKRYEDRYCMTNVESENHTEKTHTKNKTQREKDNDEAL